MLSVSDKTGIVAFARTLHEQHGIELVSTGGTARALVEAGLPVTSVESLTGYPEMMDGRVKTLHPAIHAAILADRANPAHVEQIAAQGIEPIDMVVVNLYPFEQADPAETVLADAIELIDIGGPCLIRASAKNHTNVLVVCEPDDYERVLAALASADDVAIDALRPYLALRAFRRTARYDARIADYLERVGTTKPDGSAEAPHSQLAIDAIRPLATLRYGENPHQSATAYLRNDRGGRPAGLFRVLADDTRDSTAQVEFSYNNYLDADAAFGLVAELTRADASGALPACVFIKHSNACGVGRVSTVPDDASRLHDARVEAYARAYRGDPNAAMGGILACNFAVDREFARTVLETYDRFGKPMREAGRPYAPGGFFVEVWIAPAFEPDALALIRGEGSAAPLKEWGRRVRLLPVADALSTPLPAAQQLRSLHGGLLAQSPDERGLQESDWQVVTRRRPSDTEMADLRLAWLVCKHTKSNAITICHADGLLGNGAGQMSRVMSCRLATWLARENGHADSLAGSAAASDAFFPFRDGAEILIDAGVTALIQPGGGKRDSDVVDLCNERDVAMIFTGTRHFRH